MNHNTLIKTVLVVREDNTIYGEYDYIDIMQLQIEILKGKIKEDLYYRNQYGGIDKIDKYGCSNYEPFPHINELLRDIIHLQMSKRMKNEERKKLILRKKKIKKLLIS